MAEFASIPARVDQWSLMEAEINARWSQMAYLDGPGYTICDRMEAKLDLQRHFLSRSSFHGVENSIRKTQTEPCSPHLISSMADLNQQHNSRMAEYAREIRESCARILEFLQEEIDANDSMNDDLLISEETLLSMEPMEKHSVIKVASESQSDTSESWSEVFPTSTEFSPSTELVSLVGEKNLLVEANNVGLWSGVVGMGLDKTLLTVSNNIEPFQFPPQITYSVFTCHVFDEMHRRNRVPQSTVTVRNAIEFASIRPLDNAHYVFDEMTLSGIFHFSLIKGSIHFKPWDPGTNKALESGIPIINLTFFLLEDNTILGNKSEWLHEPYVPHYNCFIKIWYVAPSLFRPHFNYKPLNISACYSRLQELLYIGDELDLKYDALLSKSTLISCNNTCLITCMYLVPFYENSMTRGFHLDQIGSLHHVKGSTSGYKSYVMVSIDGGGDGSKSIRENMLLVVVILVILALNDTPLEPLNCYTVLFLIGFRTEFYTSQGYNYVHVSVVELLEYCCLRLCIGVDFSISLKYGWFTIGSLRCVEIVKWGSRQILCDTSNGILALLENCVPLYNRFQDQLGGVLIHGQVHGIGIITCVYEQFTFFNLCFKFGDLEATRQVLEKRLKMIVGVTNPQFEKYITAIELEEKELVSYDAWRLCDNSKSKEDIELLTIMLKPIVSLHQSKMTLSSVISTCSLLWVQDYPCWIESHIGIVLDHAHLDATVNTLKDYEQFNGLQKWGLVAYSSMLLVANWFISTIIIKFLFFNVPTCVVEVPDGAFDISNNVIATANWLGTFKNFHYIFQPIEGGDMVLIQEVVDDQLKQFNYASHHVGIKQQTILPTGCKNGARGDAGCFTLTKESLQFKQWDPRKCSLVYWIVTQQLEATWKEAIINQKHRPNSNLEDKVDFNGGGNVMIQLAKTSLISKWGY